MHRLPSPWRGFRQLAAQVTGSTLPAFLPAFLALAALNLAICRRLFQVEYTDHFSSVEGYFIAMGRYISRHWGDLSWWPLWHCGMPYQDTYVPLLHLATATVATLGHVSAARAYHGVVGVTYALGAPALYWMAVRLGARRGAAFLGGLCYSLLSPSAFLMADVARDIGGLWFSRRLQVLTVYGEGPHISSMTLLPVAILALEHALAKKTGRALALAAIPIALVFLTNVPGTMALGLAVFCWIAAQPKDRLRAAWMVAAGASALAYGLACVGVPPSSLLTVGGNVGSMHPGFSNSLKHGPILLALALGAVAGAGYLLARTRLPLGARFAILFSGLLAPLAMTAREATFELLPQVGRLHLEMEMGVSVLLGYVGWAVYERFPRWIRPVVWALCLAPLGMQFDHYQTRAALDTQPADLEKRSEYTTARWLDANMSGRRVYAAGSTSFWLNAFTDTPQLIGCCDQGLSMPILNYVPYAVNSRAGTADTEIAGIWLQALGVEALVVNGPASTDEYKDFQKPERFEGRFPLLHAENGDAIYGVPQGRASLAHVLRPGETVRALPRNRVDGSEVVRYAALVSGTSRPVANFEWVRGGTARIRAHLKRDDLVSVQVAWLRGWKAYVGGERRPVSADGLGFVAIQPDCEGDCEISLAWTGQPDLPFAAVVTLAALALAAVLMARGVP